MKREKTVFAGFLMLFMVVSCAEKRNLFVLLPDAQGKQSAIVISNREGTRIIEKSNQSVEVTSANMPPSSPTHIDDESIQKNFGKVISDLPSPPLHFILCFKFDTAVLTKESRQTLARILPMIASRRSYDVTVVGHTDRVGTRQYNFKLGLERALVVRQILISQGIDTSHIEFTSHGEDDPLVKTADGVPEQRNRRAEVIIR
jgi:outer membrane protein OmpA-like peptidoglycan-associated protein